MPGQINNNPSRFKIPRPWQFYISTLKLRDGWRGISFYRKNRRKLKKQALPKCAEPALKTMQLNDILSQLGRPVAYYPKLAEFLGSVTAAIFLCQFAYWSGKEKNKGEIFKTAEEIKKETGLTIKQQKTARKILKAKGYLKEELRGIPAKIHYVFDWDKISEDWGKFISEEENKEEKEEEADISNKEGSNKFGQKGQTSLAQRVKLDWPKGSNYTIDYYIDYTYIYKTEKQTKTPKSKVSNFIKKGNTTIFI